MKRNILSIMVLLGVMVLLTGIWGYNQYNERKDYNTYLDAQFQRKFYDLIGYVENTQVDLAKAMVTNNTNDMAKYLNDAILHSYMAHEKLSLLPLEHESIYKTEVFLNQLGDYSRAMVDKSLDGRVLDEEEMGILAELHDYANELSQELIEVQEKISQGHTNFANLKRQGNRDLSKFSEEIKDFNLVNFEERMQEYPELIYDGPFSIHLQDQQAKLKGKKIDEEEAIKIINKTFKDHSKINMKVIEKLENTALAGYYMRNIEDKSELAISAAISEIDGRIIWYFNPRPIEEASITVDSAIEIAKKFLKDIGYRDMVPTYAMNHQDQGIINFAYSENGIIIYPDLIKVKVAFDNGEIIGLGTEGFLNNHHKRNIKKPEMTEKEARQRISSHIKIENTRLAIIPSAGGDEILCYELEVIFGKDTYLIYIDANTGKEVKILLMVRDKEGTLVI